MTEGTLGIWEYCVPLISTEKDEFVLVVGFIDWFVGFIVLEWGSELRRSGTLASIKMESRSLKSVGSFVQSTNYIFDLPHSDDSRVMMYLDSCIDVIEDLFFSLKLRYSTLA